MPVYVDDMRAQFRRMIMCHMIADTHEELIAMARAIGVATKWIQHAGTPHEHFDISLTKRALAIQHGAIPITWRQCAAMTKRLEVEGKLGKPQECEAWLTHYYRTHKAHIINKPIRERRIRMAVARKSKVKSNGNDAKILERARVGQLAVIVIGESRAFAGEVVEVDNETGQILAAYITGGRMLRFTLGQPPTCGLLLDWTDKQTVFSLCPRDGWESLMHARDVLEPLYRKWKERENERIAVGPDAPVKVKPELTDEERRAWLAKNSRPAKQVERGNQRRPILLTSANKKAHSKYHCRLPYRYGSAN